MGQIPAFFRKATEGVGVSYDAFDIATGTGIKSFYGIICSTGNISSSALIVTTPYSSPTVTSMSVADNTGVRTLTFDKDFDTTFNRPVIIKGVCILNVPHAIIGLDATRTYTSQIQAYVRKVSDGTETELVKASGGILVKQNTATTQEQMAAMYFDIPRTNFKIGDTLRLTVEGWYSVQGGSVPASFLIGHDPKNATATGFTNVDRNLIAQIPFVIDL